MSTSSAKGNVTVISAVAMGVGGMMGAGLYTLPGLAATSTGSLLPFAFLLAGFAAAFTVYSIRSWARSTRVAVVRRTSC